MGGVSSPAAAVPPIYSVDVSYQAGSFTLYLPSDPGIVVADFSYNAVGNYTYLPNSGFGKSRSFKWVIAASANNGGFWPAGAISIDTSGLGSGLVNIYVAKFAAGAFAAVDGLNFDLMFQFD